MAPFILLGLPPTHYIGIQFKTHSEKTASLRDGWRGRAGNRSLAMPVTNQPRIPQCTSASTYATHISRSEKEKTVCAIRGGWKRNNNYVMCARELIRYAIVGCAAAAVLQACMLVAKAEVQSVQTSYFAA